MCVIEERPLGSYGAFVRSGGMPSWGLDLL